MMRAATRCRSRVARRQTFQCSLPRQHSTTNVAGAAAGAAAADVVKGPSLLRTSVGASRPRPSLLYLPGLRALPVWTQLDGAEMTRVAYSDPTVSSVVEHLESHWRDIWNEYQAVAPGLKSDYQTDTEHSKLHQGNWDWHSFMSKGMVGDVNDPAVRNTSFATNFPKTTAVLSRLQQSNQLFEGTPFGYAFFSTLHGESKIAPHTAPMNLRLRIHLALSVPSEPDPTPINASTKNTTSSSSSGSTNQQQPQCGMRIGSLVRTWHTGKCLVIDDAYEHEVWNRKDKISPPRVVLLVDIWHPDITPSERLEIQEMFETAKRNGWLSSSS